MAERNGVELRDIASGKIGFALDTSGTGIVDLTNGTTGGPRGKHPRAFVVPSGEVVAYIGTDDVPGLTPVMGTAWQWDFQIQAINLDATVADDVFLLY